MTDNNEVRRKAQEAFDNAMRALGEDVDERPKAQMGLLDLGSVGKGIQGADICETSQKAVHSIVGIIAQFSWFIPDKYENPAVAFLTALETVILPAFCGKPIDDAAVKEPTKAKVITNFNAAVKPA